MKSISSRRIAFYGVASALMFVFLLIETYAFTAFFGSFTPAILTLPFAVALSLWNGKTNMWIGGTIFGCCSFFLAMIIANPVFINPLVSILPRILIGVVAYLVYCGLKKLLAKTKKPFASEVLPCSIAGAFGILANTVCTLTMMWIFNAAALAAVISVIMSINFLAEIIGAIVLVPVYVKLFKKFEVRL
jgi:uncharacterized membrane protein